MKCALCDKKECYRGKDCTKIKENAKEELGKNLKSIKVSAHLEAKYYMQLTRLEELILYAKEMGYKRLGIAFCIGLETEAKVIHELLAKEFEVHSVCCKACGIDKSEFDLERLHGEKEIEAICNPIGQAMILNEEKTDLNIILGLCVGHDVLFTKYSKAPVTILAVKDRVLAHNPLGAIYSGYHIKRILKRLKMS
jgi:uncharacterized metal-binding protein